MRVIAGELRGQHLVAPRGWRVRPTSDRAREATFSALGEVEGMRVLDLYCGTGALAIEALSRGASRATLVDRNLRPALGNVEKLRLRDRVELVRADAVSWIAQNETRYDLIFVDAPYRIADRVGPKLDTHLPGHLAPGGRVIVDSSTRRPMRLERLRAVRQRRYGATEVSFYEAVS